MLPGRGGAAAEPHETGCGVPLAPPLSATFHRLPSLGASVPSPARSQGPGGSNRMQQLALPAVGGAWEVQLVFWEAQLTPLSHPHSPAA